MRFDSLRVYEALDPEVANKYPPPVYYPFHHVQRLGIFRTAYSITNTAMQLAKKTVNLKMHAKREAYSRHALEIEKFLQSGKGGEGVNEVEREVEAKDGSIHTVVDRLPWRLPHSYQEMLDAGLPINEEVILMGLRGRILKHRKVLWGESWAEDAKTWEWLSEVALGVAKNHHPIYLLTENPFKLGWRDV